MGVKITVPWSIHLRSGESSDDWPWWTRRKYRDDPGPHPIHLEEQDLDHLGALHNKAGHTGKQ